ncbi:MAG: hypothetical protein HY243_17290 [Proteobacteria bacterium]|nr:hypothetical protein [Pseudomonadota bacterium]
MLRIVATAAFTAMLITPLLAEDSLPNSDTAEPSAQITFTKGYKNGFGVSGTQVYGISQTDDCSNIQYLDKLSWFTASSRSTRVAGGHRVYVLASTTYFYSTLGPTLYVQVNQTDCGGGGASFIAEVGHSYNVTEDAPFRKQCTMQVTDVQTGASPASLQMGLPESCALGRTSGGSSNQHQIPDANKSH